MMTVQWIDRGNVPLLMKRFILILALALPAFVAGSSSVLTPGPNQARSTALISELVSNYHYSRPSFDDSLSSSMLDRYIESLDPNKHFFLAEDISTFEQYRYRLDNAFKGADSTPAFEIFNIYKLRLAQRIKHALQLLEEDHYFSVDEKYFINYEDEPWLSTNNELDELWRKRVKNDILNLKLAGKVHDEITDTLRKRYERLLRRTRQQTVNDVFQVFVNAYTNSIDPHTTYFSPHNSENFNINMRLSLEGIGAALRSKNEYTLVQKVIPGGPADLSGQLKPRDRIIGVAQDQGEMLDIIGWRLQDVVEKIRGPKNSVVRLLLLPSSSGLDGPTKEITLVRDKIKLEEQAAKASVVDLEDGVFKTRIGIIDIPTFYLDFEARSRGDENFKSTTRDVRRLIRDLQGQGVEGIVIDLRDNGGGSLSEATELTGLFIPEGPVVQVRGTSGDIDINEDPDPGLAYNGPLGVLVNRNSASASEIFAGAIQDYGRGLVIGEPTFGKGTVQTLIDLNRFSRGKENLGQLKVTIAQFFRVNGDSTQHRGVRPDIVYPTAVDIADHGERSLDNALPWAKVKSTRYRRINNGWLNMDNLRAAHKSRIATDDGFSYLMSLTNEMKRVQDRKSISLVEKVRRKERDELRQRNLDLENEFRKSRGLKTLTLKDKDVDEEDFIEEDRDEEPALKIKLDEAARILADFINSRKGQIAVYPR